MQVEVELGLPRVGATAVEQVHTVGAEFCGHRAGDALRFQRDRGEVVGRDLQEVLAVPTRNHQQVAVGGGIDVHERVCRLCLRDHRGRDLAGHDAAEHTVFSHGF